MPRSRPAVVLAAVLLAAGAGVVFPANASPDGVADRMTIADLRHSVVPSYCQMPRQRLHHNETAARFLPKQGWMNLQAPGRPIYAHLQQDRRNVVATYTCTAGGVGWPQVIVAYSVSGRLLDGLYLGDYGHQEHADVTRWRPVGHSVGVRWISYEGAGFHRHRHHSRIRLDHGRLTLHPVR